MLKTFNSDGSTFQMTLPINRFQIVNTIRNLFLVTFGNGYTEREIERARRPRQQAPEEDSSLSTPPTAVIMIPFVSDSFTTQVRRAIRDSQLNVEVRIQRTTQLRHILKKLQFPRQCQKRSCPINKEKWCFLSKVVYRIKCGLCGELYIGSTTRHLHERAVEHVRAASNPASYPSYALAAHYSTRHRGSPPQLQFSPVRHYRSELDCRIREAMAIQREQPTLNQRTENSQVYDNDLLVS